MKELAWECSCGHVEYSDLPPEECPNCFKIDGFAQLPEELLVEREKDKAEEELELSISKSKSKVIKPKLKKPGRRAISLENKMKKVQQGKLRGKKK